MKKTLVLALVPAMIVMTLASCGKQEEIVTSGGTTSASSQSATSSKKDTASDTAASDKKDEAKAETESEEKEPTYDYTPGVLNTVVNKLGVPIYTDAHIDGIQIYARDGNRGGWSDDEEKIMENPENYLMYPDLENDDKEDDLIIRNINADFPDEDYYQIYVQMSGKTDSYLRCAIAKHKTIEEYQAMSEGDLSDYLWKNSGDTLYVEDGRDGNVLSRAVLIYGEDDYVEPGLYDIVFFDNSDGINIAQFVVVNVMPEAEYASKGYTTNQVIPKGDAAGSAEASADSSKSKYTDPDAEEYSGSYWEEKYPDAQGWCYFNIDVNGTEYFYCAADNEFGFDYHMDTWIDTPFNWTNWHKVGDDIVNDDETVKIKDEWVGEDAQSLSSWCTVETEPY